MAVWNPETYLRFARERNQPVIDLISRISGLDPTLVYDLGCGPGNSTALLEGAFPRTRIIGVDTSETMIAKARNDHPGLEFELRDLRDIEPGADLLFSNACLQWVPDHARLLPSLIEKLADGGTFAAQMPRNAEEPFFRIIEETVSDPHWGLQGLTGEHDNTLSTNEYYDLLSGLVSELDVWQTVYTHSLAAHEDLLAWVKGSRLRPYLQALDTDEERTELCGRILERAHAEIPVQADGRVLLHFRRVFIRAKR